MCVCSGTQSDSKPRASSSRPSAAGCMESLVKNMTAPIFIRGPSLLMASILACCLAPVKGWRSGLTVWIARTTGVSSSRAGGYAGAGVRSCTLPLWVSRFASAGRPHRRKNLFRDQLHLLHRQADRHADPMDAQQQRIDPEPALQHQDLFGDFRRGAEQETIVHQFLEVGAERVAGRHDL